MSRLTRQEVTSEEARPDVESMSSTLANSQEVGEPVAQSSDAGESNEAFGSGLIVAVVLGPSSLGFASLGFASLGGVLPGAGSLDPKVVGPSSLGLASVGGAVAGTGSFGLAGPASFSPDLASVAPTSFDRASIGPGVEGPAEGGVPLLAF